MNTETVLEQLSEISIGSVIAIIAAVTIVCTGAWKIVSKMLRMYDGYTGMRDERDRLKQRVEASEHAITEMEEKFAGLIGGITQQLVEIKGALDEQRETKIKELRHAIVVAGENALANGTMTAREWTSLHEMVNEYVNIYHQNWYVKPLIAKVDRDVRVIGQLDEHGNDIE